MIITVHRNTIGIKSTQASLGNVREIHPYEWVDDLIVIPHLHNVRPTTVHVTSVKQNYNWYFVVGKIGRRTFHVRIRPYNPNDEVFAKPDSFDFVVFP